MKKKKILNIVIVCVLIVSLFIFADNVFAVSNENVMEGHVGEGICNEKEAIQAIHTVGYILFVAKIIAPFIIIGAAILDMAKAVIDPDKGMKSSVKSLIIRLVIGILIFFTPTIVYSILGIAQDISLISEDSEPCRQALLDPWNYGGKKDDAQESGPKVGGIDYNTDPRFTTKPGIDYNTDPRYTTTKPGINYNTDPRYQAQ